MKVIVLFISWCVLVMLCWGAVLAGAIIIGITVAFARGLRRMTQLTFIRRGAP